MTLEYEVVYSERCTIGITVERNRRVIVRAPLTAPPEAVSAAVDRKRLWIWAKLRDQRKYTLLPLAKEFDAGEGLLFLGQNYSLELVREPRDGVRLNGRCFELPRRDRRSGKDLFHKWFLTEARKHIPPR